MSAVLALGLASELEGADVPPGYSPDRHTQQLTATSLLCGQLVLLQGLCSQLSKLSSAPVQLTFVSQTAPLPPLAMPQKLSSRYFSFLHTTEASILSKPSEHTVPQYPSCQTCERG